MCPRWSHILTPLTEAVSGPKCGKLLWNDALESSFKELKHMVSAETLLIYSDWTTSFSVHTDASDKQLGSVIIHNKKTTELFSIILSNTKRKYTNNEKELLTIV